MKRLICAFSAIFCLAATAPAQSFYDNFTRGSDPGPLGAWTVNSGTWTVTGGTFQSGLNPSSSYAFSYITNNFTNYTVQARIKFPVGAFGGGLGGRVNTTSGAHYAAWVYPENSVGGSNMLKLIKFQNFGAFAYLGVGSAPITTANLAAVGTGFHTVRMDFQTNRIIVFFDGVQMINTNDIETTYYTNGAVMLDMWTDASQYLLTVDDVAANASLALTSRPDTNTAVSGLALTVAAPGILANDTGGAGPLAASLVTAPTRGILSLSSNGGFTYTATNGFTGTDSFNYRANDGVTSSTNTVTLIVTPDTPPVANGDFYSTPINTTLSVPAPGVLANDTDVDGNSLTAALVLTSVNGTLTLTNNGGFTYVPNNGFVGSDSFTYRASDGISNSTSATVTISVQPPGLFSDDFTRGTDPGPLTPWVTNAGSWSITGGQLKGGNNPLFSYGFIYITNNWSNYVVSARMQFPAGAFGGGLGGRLNPATGAHYAAWVYPEGSVGGALNLKLIKFSNFGTFTGVTNVLLSSVGTNFHTVALAFHGSRIAVYFDGTQMISAIDTDYSSGAISLDFWTDATAYVMSADDVSVNNLVRDDNYAVNQGSVLSVPAAGVLANDTEVYTTSLTASVLANPAHGTLTLTNNGGFTYTPSNNFNGSDSFTYQATDGGTNLGSATVSISVNVVNTAPELPAQTNRTMSELTTNTVVNTATDSDLPAQTLTYSLTVTPAAATATINTNTGVITFAPTESQGPGTYTFTTIVTDNGAPPLKDTNSFQITVQEVNTAPTLPNQTNRTVNELATLTVNNAATDTDLPANTLTYLLTNSPTGATISSGGVITWTPTEAQGPGDYTITAIVRDNGTPQFSATNSFSVHVNEVNTAPAFLATPANRTVLPLASLVITNAATDSDVPANTLSYSLLNQPAGASISSSGVITWTPAQDQDVTTNVITTVVTDNGTNQNNLSATNSFIIVVNDHPIPAFSNSTLLVEGCMPTNNAADPGETVTMSFSFRNVGLVNTTNLTVTLLEGNGVLSPSGAQNYGVVVAGGSSISQPFTFTANGSCGGTISPVFQLQDNALDLGQVSGSVSLGGTGTLYTENFDTVVTPALPAGWSTSSTNGPLWITATNTDPTVTNSAYVTNGLTPNLALLVSPVLTLPLGQSQISFRHKYGFERSASSSPITYYDGGILEIKIGTNVFRDIIVAGGSFLSNGYNATITTNTFNPLANRSAWGGTFTNNFTNVVVNLPLSAAGQNIQLRWVLATDNLGVAAGWWVDSLALNGALCCLNTAPVLTSQTNRTIDELTALVVTNTASDNTTPPSGLSYSLTVLPPATNATISSDGVIFWTPSEAQGPGTYTLTTVVSDNASPPLSATNSFDVTVLDVNSAPILPATTNYTIGELATLFVTNTAADSDVPANNLSYTLVDPPANATINNTNGVITFTPSESQGPGVYTITTLVTDDGSPTLSASNSFTVTVNEINIAPVLPGTTNYTIAELTTLTVTNTASDSDLPANLLSYTLVDPPANATINTNGVITFNPSESQGPGVYTITTLVTDDGSPSLSASNTFTVTVTETNSAPTLPGTTNYTIAELTTLTVTNTASDSDLPANLLSYTLVNPPANATINTNGVITFNPSESQGPGVYTITTLVSDDGSPALSASNSFTVTVTETNSSPTLPGATNYTIAELTTLTVTNAASDSDLPANLLSYTLVNPPANATINTNGVITFTPSESEGPGVYTITTLVTDDGSPSLSASNSFTVTVTEVNTAPTLPGTTNYTIAELTTLTVTNTASDSDLPANLLSYALVNPPANATINTNGVITFNPSESQGPGVYTITTLVTDDGSPSLSASNSFTVTVTETNSAPTLPGTTNYTIAELTTLTVTNTASDSDLPANLLGYTLVNPPANATINTNGVIVFTPSAAQAPSTNIIETVVTDDGLPPLSATNFFTVVVSPPLIVSAPTILSIGVTNGEATVTWTSVSGRVYRLQYKDDVLGTNWQSVEPDVTATASTAAGSNAIGEAAQRYYRVQVLP